MSDLSGAIREYGHFSEKVVLAGWFSRHYGKSHGIRRSKCLKCRIDRRRPMRTRSANGVLAGPLRSLWGIGVASGLTDGQLIERIGTGSGEAAELSFQLLVERHGPMVLRVCQQMLNDPNDADDAFQATFLVLLRQAHRIRNRASAASWLHGVAARIAARAKVDASRRRRIERRGARQTVDPKSDWERLDRELRIQHELALLPEKYRAPVVLCYLEGLTHENAADQLGWPVGTVRGRLARARDLLRARLTRCGITASAALAAADSLTESARAAVPATLRDATLRATTQVASGQALAAAASARAVAWAEGTSRVMTFYRWNAAAGVFLMIVTLGIGLVLAAASPPQSRPPEAKAAPPPAAQEDQTSRLREMLQLKGTWTSPQMVTDRSINGVPQPPKPFKLIWSIDRDTITETDDDGFAWHTYRFTLTPDQTPKTIDLTLLNTDLELHGIYKLEGDTLTICHGLERPKSFEVNPTQLPLVFQRETRTPAQLAPEIPNAPGCYWADVPDGGVPTSWASGGISYIVQKDPQGAMIVTLAFVAKLQDGEPNAEYRPVAVDDKKQRYLFEEGDAAWSTSGTFRGIVLAHGEYRLDPKQLPFDRVRRLGIEVVPVEIRRANEAASSVRAFQEARDAGIELLPRPEVGKPFELNLTDSQGRPLRSDDFKGKVVLIDVWAGWRKPCMGRLADVTALYERRDRDGFEVVGVNFEDSRANTERLVKALSLPWPQVVIPDDDRTRRLWSDGPGLRGTPKLILIDRDGSVRWAGGPDEIEKQITDLLDASRR
jgi:RNA polymerase sigma factor (sigma-70 family)